MAINYQEVLIDADSIRDKASEIYRLAGSGVKGKTTIETIGDIDFTTADIKKLDDRYAVLKSELSTLIGGLP